MPILVKGDDVGSETKANALHGRLGLVQESIDQVQKVNVALGALYRFFLNFEMCCILSCLSQLDNNKQKGSSSSFLSCNSLKLKLRVF